MSSLRSRQGGSATYASQSFERSWSEHVRLRERSTQAATCNTQYGTELAKGDLTAFIWNHAKRETDLIESENQIRIHLGAFRSRHATEGGIAQIFRQRQVQSSGTRADRHQFL